MDRPTSKVLARRATRVRPGVIVSTIVEESRAQTVTFTRDEREPVGFRMVVEYSARDDARTAHQRAVSMVRHPSWTRVAMRHEFVAAAPPAGVHLAFQVFDPAGAERILSGLESRLAVRARRGGVR